MKTTMVARERVRPRGSGGSAAPHQGSAYCAGLALARAGVGEAGAHSPPLPPSVPIRGTGGCSARLRPPRSSVMGEGERGPLLWPPRSPPALPPPPAHGTAGSEPSCRAPGQHLPSSLLLHPWDPPPGSSSPAPRWAQHPCKPVARFHNSTVNWEELGGFSSGKYQPLGHGTAKGAGVPPPRPSPVPPGTQRPPQPPQPCQGEPRSRHSGPRSHRRAKGICP